MGGIVIRVNPKKKQTNQNQVIAKAETAHAAQMIHAEASAYASTYMHEHVYLRLPPVGVAMSQFCSCKCRLPSAM